MNALFSLVAGVLLEETGGLTHAEVERACDVVIDFLLRLGHSPSSLRAFVRAVRRKANAYDPRVPAVLRTPSGDSTAVREDIVAAMERSLDRTTELSEHADPALLGGAVLTVGDERLDMSLRGALSALYISLSPTV